MQFTITIPQRQIIALNEQYPDLPNLDIKDAAIIDFCSKFSHTAKITKFHHEGQTYYWFNHKHISEELPIIKLSPDRVYRHIKNICAYKIFDPHPDNRGNQRSYYKFGTNYTKLVFDKPLGANDEASAQIPRGIGANTEAPSAQTPKDQYTINQLTINQNKESKKIDLPSFQKKNEKYLNLYEKVKPLFPDSITNKLTPAKRAKWLDCLRLLIENDGYTEEEIYQVIIWTRKDDFWSQNFQALPKLRRNDKDGVPYYLRLREEMNAKKAKMNKKQNGRTVYADDVYDHSDW